MTPEKKIELLEVAKSYIDASWITGDWVRKNPNSPTGVSVCAIGALRMANQSVQSLEKRQTQSNQLALALARALPTPYLGNRPVEARSQVIFFNDSQGRAGKEKVQRLFERAICQAKHAAKNADSPKVGSSPTPRKRAKKQATK